MARAMLARASVLLAPGQRVISINHQRAQLEYFEEYQNLDVGRVGYRVTYVVDMRYARLLCACPDFLSRPSPISLLYEIYEV